MKKLIISIIFLFVLLHTGALAYDNDFSVYSKDNAITKIETSLDIKDSLLIVYNNDSTISNVHKVTFKNQISTCIIQIPEDDYFIKLYYDIGKDKSSLILPDQITEIKETEYNPPEYPTGAAVLGAVGIIKSSDKVVSEDDEIVNRIVCLYRGEEVIIDLEEDFKINATTPETAIYDGMNVSKLNEGDLVSFSAYLNGNISDVNLLFRPYQTDIITQNNNIILPAHSKKFSTFGVIKEKLKNGTVVLYDKTGLESQALYLSLHEHASVYVYDMNKKKDKVSIGTVADIIKSEILPSEMDDNDNIITWGQDNVRNYAYVRVYDGIICDIVVFANYNS